MSAPQFRKSSHSSNPSGCVDVTGADWAHPGWRAWRSDAWHWYATDGGATADGKNLGLLDRSIRAIKADRAKAAQQDELRATFRGES